MKIQVKSESLRNAIYNALSIITPVKVVVSKGALRIDRFAVPIYGDSAITSEKLEFEFNDEKWARVFVFLKTIPNQFITCVIDEESVSVYCVAQF